MLAKIWSKGNPPKVLWECKLVQPLSKIVYPFLKKLKTELRYDPASLLLGIYLEKKQKHQSKFVQTPRCS